MSAIAKQTKEMKVADIRLREKTFGDIQITLWKSTNGNMYLTLSHGKPDVKTFCAEHFLMLAAKFREMADELERMKTV